jgi:hypothetical protein
MLYSFAIFSITSPLLILYKYHVADGTLIFSQTTKLLDDSILFAHKIVFTETQNFSAIEGIESQAFTS